MAVIGVDDTDSRERGMCTTYLAQRLAARIRDRGAAVDRLLLVRLNPAVPHKTRGNAAVAVHADLNADMATRLATAVVEDHAEVGDPDTQPGLVVAPDSPDAVPDAIRSFTRRAIRDHETVDTALGLADEAGYVTAGWNGGRGRIGALAAVGAWPALEDWTVEHIAYRGPDRWGTDRDVDAGSVFEAATAAYPDAWDTVDRGAGEVVCVPRTPGPVLYGVRGDDTDAVRSVADGIESEPVAAAATFVTNQGTDAHLAPADPSEVRDGRSYRVTARVTDPPETVRGGHVFVGLGAGGDSLRCVAFEPTKRFRDHVRALRPGDRVTACGEVTDGTLKLEKFAVRDLVRDEAVTPTCDGCGRRMESAGADQGYRCRRCGTTAAGKARRRVDRDLDPGWYEVPPRARRHIAKPLVRGGFDAPTHPER